MSIITTWKCDGCGRICRRQEETRSWLTLTINGPAPTIEEIEDGVFDMNPFISGRYPNQTIVHVCTPACLAILRETVVEQVQEMLK